ncbi:MAG: carboxypeptidase-like regulatory domain-containing protein [Chitinophagaceae bacterium]|nr:carboxypeptidase-like regulatory domain-containing protein [Chitinophagaceae bacterium]MCU0403237.1 carboxypeptidase-like regulatory domain-containing protein [Chitinophagaceae bacterium]
MLATRVVSFFAFCLLFGVAIAQEIEVKGVIYDISQKTPLEGVSVMATNGSGTSTDEFGRYKIMVRPSDSLFFSYQGKETAKYPVLKMEDFSQFNMALHVYVHALPNVIVRPPDYRMDSIQNRLDYAKYFDYKKPNPISSINVGPTGVGMDPNEIINMFRFKRNRQLASLQRRLIQEEEDKYIDFRFSAKFISELTGLKDEELKLFMRKYRPPYDFVVITNNLELGYYIQQCYKKERGLLPPGVPIYNLGPVIY